MSLLCDRGYLLQTRVKTITIKFHYLQIPALLPLLSAVNRQPFEVKFVKRKRNW